MSGTDNRLHADKSTEELRIISQYLEQRIKSLCDENAVIQRELESRDAAGPPKQAVALDTGGRFPLLLDYRGSHSKLAAVGMIGESYSDAARHYALRASLIASAVIFLAFTALCALLMAM